METKVIKVGDMQVGASGLIVCDAIAEGTGEGSVFIGDMLTGRYNCFLELAEEEDTKGMYNSVVSMEISHYNWVVDPRLQAGIVSITSRIGGFFEPGLIRQLKSQAGWENDAKQCTEELWGRKKIGKGSVIYNKAFIGRANRNKRYKLLIGRSPFGQVVSARLIFK